MLLPGLKKVKAIEIDPDHVVTSDEEPDAVDDGNNGEPEDDNGNSGDNNGEGEGNEGGDGEGGDEGSGSGSQPSSKVLTVAEAKLAPDKSTITVNGYIVGAIMSGTDVNNFTYCFEKGETKPYFEKIRAGILLADEPYKEGKEYDLVGFTDLLPVKLNACKRTKDKEQYNLCDNPDKQNMFVQIKGIKCLYIVQDALGDEIEFTP